VSTSTIRSRATRRRCRSSHVVSRANSSRITVRVSPPGRTGSLARMTRLGAIPHDDSVVFCVWAPNANQVAVRLDSGDYPLERTGPVSWTADLPARAGDDYRYVLDGKEALPDPCSRFQPEGILGPSRVVDTTRFDIAPRPKLALEDIVLYELHVGTFTREG